jgi:hypothetical protein
MRARDDIFGESLEDSVSDEAGDWEAHVARVGFDCGDLIYWQCDGERSARHGLRVCLNNYFRKGLDEVSEKGLRYPDFVLSAWLASGLSGRTWRIRENK